jgi:hypothetical protein
MLLAQNDLAQNVVGAVRSGIAVLNPAGWPHGDLKPGTVAGVSSEKVAALARRSGAWTRRSIGSTLKFRYLVKWFTNGGRHGGKT